MTRKKDTPQEHPICATCRRRMEYGNDVVTVEEGVIGPRGLVPLGKKRFYCDESCLRADVSDVDEDIVVLPPRVP